MHTYRKSCIEHVCIGVYINIYGISDLLGICLRFMTSGLPEPVLVQAQGFVLFFFFGRSYPNTYVNFWKLKYFKNKSILSIHQNDRPSFLSMYIFISNRSFFFFIFISVPIWWHQREIIETHKTDILNKTGRLKTQRTGVNISLEKQQKAWLEGEGDQRRVPSAQTETTRNGAELWKFAKLEVFRRQRKATGSSFGFRAPSHFCMTVNVSELCTFPSLYEFRPIVLSLLKVNCSFVTLCVPIRLAE